MFAGTSKISAGSSICVALAADDSASVGLTTSMVRVMASGPLHSSTDENQATLGAGNGTLDEQQPALGVDLDDLEALSGLRVDTHPAGHPHTLEDTTGRRTSADRAGLAVVTVRTVRGGNAV